MPKLNKIDKEAISARHIEFLGEIRQWQDGEVAQGLLDSTKVTQMHLAEQLKAYLKYPSWDNESHIAQALSQCVGRIDEVLAPILETLEIENKSLSIKNQLERKLEDYRLKEERPSFWDKSAKTYRAKREVLNVLKQYLYNQCALQTLNEKIDSHRGVYDAGWYSALDELIHDVKDLKKKRLFDLVRSLKAATEADQTLLNAIFKFSQNKVNQVYLIGVFESVQDRRISKSVFKLYQLALNADEAAKIQTLLEEEEASQIALTA